MRHFKTYLELGAVEPEDAFQCQLGGGAVGDHPLLHLRVVLAGQDIHLTARPLHVGPCVAKALDRVLARPAHRMQSSAHTPSTTFCVLGRCRQSLTAPGASLRSGHRLPPATGPRPWRRSASGGTAWHPWTSGHRERVGTALRQLPMAAVLAHQVPEVVLRIQQTPLRRPFAQHASRSPMAHPCPSLLTPVNPD